MRQDTFSASDGTEIAYYSWPGTTTLPPVILHHGFVANTRTNWVGTGVVDALTAAGRHVVALDARGHGGSGKSPDPSRYGEPRMALDLIALVDLLDSPTVHLVGYSMGAVVSLIAATQDQRITRLVVGGIGAGAAELGGVDTREAPLEAMVAALRAETVEDAPPQTRPFRALADALGADLPSLAAHARSLHNRPIDLDAVRVPTLVLAGDADPLARRPEVLSSALPQGSLTLVPGNHLTATRDPGFANSIVDFLGRA